MGSKHRSLVIKAVTLALLPFTWASTASASTIPVGRTSFTITSHQASAAEIEAGRWVGGHPFDPAQNELTECNWLDAIPGARSARLLGPSEDLSTTCDPILPGKEFGFVTAPATSQPKNGVLREAFQNSKTHKLTVGPVLMTYGFSADSSPVAAEANGSIWICDPDLVGNSQVLRFSLANGAHLQTASAPSLRDPIIEANSVGFFLAQTNEAPVGFKNLGVYFVQVGASKARLIQPMNKFVWAMQGAGKTMDVLESGLSPTSPRVEYRFVAVDH